MAQVTINPRELDRVMARVTLQMQNLQSMDERKYQGTSTVTYGHGGVAQDVHECFMK